MDIKNKLATNLNKTSAAVGIALLSSLSAQAFEIQTSQGTVNLYGFAQFNAVYDFNQNVAGGAQEGNFSSLVAGPTVAKGHFDAGAQESRLGFEFDHTSDLKISLEGDFYNGTFRLRHAFGQYHNWLIGKTWSNYSSFVGSTPTLDFNGLVALAGANSRYAQIRYQFDNLSVSLEEQAPFTVVGTTAADVQKSLPVLTAKYENKSHQMVSYAVGLLLQQPGFDSGTFNDKEMGIAGFAAADFNFADFVTLHLTANYSKASSNYLYLSGGTIGYLEGNGLKAVNGYGGSIGLSFKNVLGGNINLGYGLIELDFDGARNNGNTIADTSDKSRMNGFVNYMWYPMENVMMGVEYGYFDVKQVNDAGKDAQRLMFSTRYSF